MTRLMHENNINHRDLYLCHFLWRGHAGEVPGLVLIDLHRALIHKKLPYRWRIKAEEAALIQHFGPKYQDYRARTWAVLPGL